jgi:DNA repair exonuclease SbcCD ATPase subunit
MDKELILTLLTIVAGSGGIWAFMRWLGERGTRQAQEGKLHREAESIAVQAVTDAMESLSDELERVQAALNEDRQTMALLNRKSDKLESKCGEFEQDIARLDGEAEKWRLFSLLLTRQLDANGIPPVLTLREVENMTVDEVRVVFQENSIELGDLTPPDEEL